MNAKPWQIHLRPTLAELHVYDAPPADASLARLNANECPEPWPAEAMARVAEVVASVELGRYPDTSGRRVRALLAARHDCSPDRIVLGNGSDEVISFIVTALSGGPGALVIPTPTFVMYRHMARVLGVEVREVPTQPDLQLDPEGMAAALQGAALCFFARPNNPTGVLFDRDVIESLVERFPQTVFVVDEAYGAYAPGSSLYRPDHPSNVVHMSTMSKLGGAAIRLGYAVADPDLALALDKVRPPYNVSATSLAIAELLLTELAPVQRELVQRALARRTRVAHILARIPGIDVLPSSANFVLGRLPSSRHAAALGTHLAHRGVLIKDCSSTPGLAGCIRVSVGTDDDLDRLEAGVASWS